LYRERKQKTKVQDDQGWRFIMTEEEEGEGGAKASDGQQMVGVRRS
jgi:hypothetical protein